LSTGETTRRNGLNPSYRFPVWNGLLESKHVKLIGPALWVFLWCIDKTTKEKDGKGIVYGGKPVTFAEIAEDLGVSEKTIQRHIDRLADANYLELILTPRGQQIRVLNSCKFTKSSESERPSKVSNPSGQKCPTRQDRRVTPQDRTVHPPDKSVQPNIREGSLTLNLDKEREKEVEKAPAAAKTAPQPLCSPPSVRKDSEEETATPNPPISALFGKTAKTLEPPRLKSEAELDATRRLLLKQREELMRRYPPSGKAVATA
jgi:DNA-binding transcriptional ArsR family regulator